MSSKPRKLSNRKMQNLQRKDPGIRRMSRWARRHDVDYLKVRCPFCNSYDASSRGEPEYHNHPPVGRCLDEIWECDRCGRYFLVIYRLIDVRPLIMGASERKHTSLAEFRRHYRELEREEAAAKSREKPAAKSA